MSALFLLPGLVSLILVIRRRIDAAFLSVYLPCLLLLPNGYEFRPPHLPAVTAAQSALIPIGVVALVRFVKSGLPSFMDTIIVLFMLSITASEVFHERVLNDGIFHVVNTFFSIVLAYAVGRRLIEPDLRVATVRRFVVLILLLGPFGLYEWRMGQNLFGFVGQRFFGLEGVHADVQFRSGRGRMAVSFNDSELAGLVFGMAAALNAWLFYLRKWRSNVSLGKTLDQLEKFHIPGLLLLFYVFLSQSRGPMLAVAVGYMILQIPRFNKTKPAMIVVAILLAIGAVAAYRYLNAYTNIDPSAIANEQQGSAIYRRQMNEFYQPLVKMGGALGWGYLSHPIVPGMFSIDNGFLLIHLAYGDSGYILFVLISLESLRVLIMRSWQFKQREDQALAIALLAALAVFWISITTAYMGEQTPQIAFLLMGWSQSLRPGSTQQTTAQEYTATTKFGFRKVFS